MPDVSYHPNHLIIGYVREMLTPEEQRQLSKWVDSSEQNRAYFEYITNPENLKKAMLRYGSADGDKIWELIKQRVPELPVQYKPVITRH